MTAALLLHDARVPVEVGEYEGHHLRCPRHGRTSPGPHGQPDCGCVAIIAWVVRDWGEAAPLEVDTLGIGRRRYAR